MKRIPSRYQANKRSIHERPPIHSIGHWEGDTIIESERKLRIVTYVDKMSGYLVADKVSGSADTIHEKAKTQFRELPCVSITYDNGSEFALHRLIERDTKATVYFADPGKPHQRGTNENTNGLLRQYFPKGSAFGMITNSDVQRAVMRLNNRPRKRLNYLTPREFLEKEGVRFRLEFSPPQHHIWCRTIRVRPKFETRPRCAYYHFSNCFIMIHIGFHIQSSTFV